MLRAFVPAPGWVMLVAVACGAAAADESPRVAPFFAPNRQFSAPVRSWMAIRGQNVVLQQHEYSCGAASLCTILRYYYNDDVSETEVLDAALGKLEKNELDDREKNGLSMEDLARGASKLNYPAAVLEVSYQKLCDLPAPVVVRMVEPDFKHFVVFRGEVEDRVFVADPLRGNVRMRRSHFLKAWDGKILAVAKRNAKPRKVHPLQVPPGTLATPEEQAARRSLFPPPRIR